MIKTGEKSNPNFVKNNLEFGMMKTEDKSNPSCVKSYAFALRIIGLFQKLQSEKKEYILSKQLLGSGTSIGASGKSEWITFKNR